VCVCVCAAARACTYSSYSSSTTTILSPQACSIWMPLDPVSLESTIEFVAGSQHAPALYRPRKFATSNNYPLVEDATDEQYEDVPDIENDRDKYKIIKWAVEVKLPSQPIFRSLERIQILLFACLYVDIKHLKRCLTTL